MKHWLLLLPLAAVLVSAQEAPSPSSPPDVKPMGAIKGSAPAESEPGIGSPASLAVQPKQEAPPAAAAPNNAIPEAYSEAHYASTWSKNPFLLEVKRDDGPKAPGFAEDWELRGLVTHQGQPEALLNNKKTQEYHWVKTIEDKDGFKLVEANRDRDLHKSSVKVAKGGESATFTFPEIAAAPPTGARPGGPMVPGAPIRQPGMPPSQPGMQQAPPNGMMPRPNPGMPQPGNTNGIPRINPGNQPPRGVTPMGNVQPNNGGRRRVLIPPKAAP